MNATRPVRAGAVVLAAGLSRRMKGIDKLLLAVDGMPLVRRSVTVLREAGLAPLVVVTGPQSHRVAALFADTGVRVVHNASQDEGLQTSVLAGLRSLVAEAVDAVLVAPADQPLLTADDIRSLLAAWRDRPLGTAIVVPWYQGERGNPVVFDLALIPDILTGEGGARGYIDRHPDRVHRYDAANDHFCADLDTREDLARLRERVDIIDA